MEGINIWYMTDLINYWWIYYWGNSSLNVNKVTGTEVIFNLIILAGDPIQVYSARKYSNMAKG